MTRASADGANIARIHTEGRPVSRFHAALPLFVILLTVSNATAFTPSAAGASTSVTVRSIAIVKGVPVQFVTVIVRRNTAREGVASVMSQAPSCIAEGTCHVSNV